MNQNGKFINYYVTFIPNTINRNIVGLYGIIRINETKDRYLNLLDTSPQPIIVHSDNTIIYANQMALDLIGADHLEEACSKPFLDLVHVDHRDFVQIVRLDGQVIEVSALATPIDWFGKIARQVLLRDITQQKRNEELLIRSEKLAVIGQLAAGVAHEIRNPLTSIKGFVQLLQSRTTDNQEYYKIILSELNRINDIVSEFMVYAKPDVIVFKMRNIEVILLNVITLMRSQALMRNIQLSSEFEHDIPLIHCDENRLKQVFINLIKNAIEAMPSGGSILIRVKYKNGKKIRVFIMDQGEGIPKKLISKLGEPFFTTKEGGTGLGLMICNKIIEDD